MPFFFLSLGKNKSKYHDSYEAQTVKDALWVSCYYFWVNSFLRFWEISLLKEAKEQPVVSKVIRTFYNYKTFKLLRIWTSFFQCITCFEKREYQY